LGGAGESLAIKSFATGAATYTFVWLTRLGGFYDKQFVESISKDFGLGPMRPWVSIVLYFLFTATISVIRDCATVLGEEIGWRGFLIPELAKRNETITRELAVPLASDLKKTTQ
jgi:hypothetical protein